MADTMAPLSEEIEEEEEEEEYIVEEILNHRVTRKGKIEYYLRWKGFTDEDNTWEPAENLNCKDLVDIYELKKEKDKTEKKKEKETTITNTKGVKVKSKQEGKTSRFKDKPTENSAPPAKRRKENEKVNGFDRGLTIDEIIGAMDADGEVKFLIKWKEGSNNFELIPAKIVNVNIPQMVIKWYESRLKWATSSSKSSEEENEDQVKENGTAESGDDITNDEADATEPPASLSTD